MKQVELTLWPEEAFDEERLPQILAQKLGVKEGSNKAIKIIKRSIDARSKKVCVRFQCEIIPTSEKNTTDYTRKYDSVQNARQVLIVGAGPAGLFAALRL